MLGLNIINVSKRGPCCNGNISETGLEHSCLQSENIKVQILKQQRRIIRFLTDVKYCHYYTMKLDFMTKPICIFIHRLFSWCLTHWGRVTHIFVNKTIIGPDNGLSADWRQAIIWTDEGNINWALRNKLQWNYNQNSCIFIQENVLENVAWEMSAIFCRPQCVNKMCTYHEVHHFYLMDSRVCSQLTYA